MDAKIEATRRPDAFRPFQIGRGQSRIRASGHPITLPLFAALIALSTGNFIFRANRLQNNFSLRPIHRPGYDLSKRGISPGRPGSRLPGIILARKTQARSLGNGTRERKRAHASRSLFPPFLASNRSLSSITTRTRLNRIPSGKESTASGLNRFIFERGSYSACTLFENCHFYSPPSLVAFFFSLSTLLLPSRREYNTMRGIKFGETRSRCDI